MRQTIQNIYIRVARLQGMLGAKYPLGYSANTVSNEAKFYQKRPTSNSSGRFATLPKIIESRMSQARSNTQHLPYQKLKCYIYVICQQENY